MHWTYAFILFYLQQGFAAEIVSPNNKVKVHYLEPQSSIEYVPNSQHRGFFQNDMQTYCYRGVNKTLGRLFESIELQFDIEEDDFTQYEGSTPEEVKEHCDEQRSLFSFSLFSQKRRRLQMSPFKQQCFGIETIQKYKVRLHQLRVDFWRVIQLFVGVILFVYAGTLSHNALFYYITGIALGICSSFMLLIWLSSKLFPRRPMMYGVLIGGWTIGLYVIQLLWENLQVIVLTYRTYVFYYILVTGIVSFFFCYRLGPPKNIRSKNIIKWLLQLMALLLIYFCSHFEEATAAIIIMTLLLYYFPHSFLYKIRAFYVRKFPPKRRLLTSEEFYEQGAIETTKALTELRSFASSPNCKQWQVMSKLKDPMRFAAFVEGASHLRDEEILHYESRESENDSEDSEISLDEENQPEPIGDGIRMANRWQRQSYSMQDHSLSPHELSEEDEYVETRKPGVSQRASSSVRQRTPVQTHSYRNSPTTSQSNSHFSPRINSRSARMVDSARTRNGSVQRYEMREFSGDSD